MSHRILIPILLLLLLLLAGLSASAQDEPGDSPESTGETQVRTLLDSIRDDLVELRFEKALAAIEALLGEPGMTEAERAELLVLRSQTHVAFGDLDAAEEDYRLILRMRPAFLPDASLIPAKAMDRFSKVRAATIGRLRIQADPADATLTLDGRPVSVSSGSALLLVAGEHEVVAERPGHDALRRNVDVPPDGEIELSMVLTANSRTVILRTEPDDVEVWLDGLLVGRTRRAAGDFTGSDAAELMIENIPLGEHDFELRRSCFRTERMRDTLTVDLLDRSPKRYRTVALAEARGSLNLTGAPAGSRIRIDGRSTDPGTEGPLQVCPGTFPVEVDVAGRTVWHSSVQIDEGASLDLRIEPRPNFVLVGAEDWPIEWRGFVERFNAQARVAAPVGADLTTSRGWGRVALPEHTDLALAIIPASRPGASDLWLLYSPIVRSVQPVASLPGSLRPVWSVFSWGFETVDSRVGGGGRVAWIGPSGPEGLSVGDQIVAIAGEPVDRTERIQTALRALDAGPVEIEWLTGGGESRKTEMRASVSPRLEVHHATPEEAMLRAAWAVVDALGRPSEGAVATANLALIFAEFGHHDLALDSWRRVRWSERDGVGPGTARYYAGRALERLGHDADAVKAYRDAFDSDARAFDDRGPRVSPAAADRLADLGVSTRP